MNLKTKLSLLVFIFFSFVTFAQEKYILTGTVNSEQTKTPLPGVNVTIKGTQRSTSTDFDGKYSIKVASGEELLFSYIGTVSKTIKITNQKTLDVNLMNNENQLEQIIVVGYGTQKKKNLTGSISKVSGKVMEQIPTSRIDDALNGQVAGVTIQQNNPTAGGAPSIKVRGQGSVSFSGSPLIVVDGIVLGNDADFLGSLDMNNVESVEVLKDASSSSIYGSRGAYGVIMITSKKGKEGMTKFSYNTYTGYKFVPKTTILSTPEKWTEYVLVQNNGVLTPQMEMIKRMGTYTNWEEVMYDGGIITDHNLSISGGNENTKFRSSLGYNNDEGVQLTDNYKKLNFSLNIDTKAGKLEYGAMLNPSHTKQRLFAAGNGNINYIRQQPWLPIYLDENSIKYVNPTFITTNGVKIGDYAEERFFTNYDLATNTAGTGTTSINVTGDANPYANVVERKNEITQTKLYGNTYFKYNFNDHFSFKQTLGGDYRLNKTINRTGVKVASKTAALGSTASTAYSATTKTHISSESLFNYNRTFGKHDLNVIAGATFETFNTENIGLTGTLYTNDLIETISTNNVAANAGFTTEKEEKLISYLSRINYSFDNKYLLSLSIRADGSSKFGSNNKFGYFPAASVGWRVSNENFLMDNNTIKDLKLRVSYGTTGNNSAIDEYASIVSIPSIGTGFANPTGITGYNISNLANPDLKWEKLVEFNPGIDAELFGGVFGFSFDYYIRTNEDLLLNLPVPAVTGFGTFLTNAGKVENKGFELELHSTNIKTNTFSWTSSALLSHNENTLVDFEGNSGLVSVVDPKRAAEWVALEGHPISSFYGYVATNEIDPKYIKNPLYPINSRSQDVYVKDINGDGKITTDDRTILGDNNPDFVWSFTNNLKFKNIDFSFMFQGSHGAEVRNMDSQYLYNEFNDFKDYSTTTTVAPVNGLTPATTAFPDGALVRERIFTSQDIQDASYIALRNINLGYSFSKQTVEKFSLSKFRLYAAAQNLLYIMADDYVGYNPEGTLPTNTSPLTAGYQVGAAPIYKTISFGLNIEF
jgi:TonB-linked SusC/RagA family outer membrane protein